MAVSNFKFINLFNEINKTINEFKKLIIIIFFSIIFLTGILSVKDYGTVNEEYNQRLNGFITLNYLGEKFLPEITKKYKGDKEFSKFSDVPEHLRYYGGVVLHSPLAFLEVILGINDKKNVFLFKHYVYFLIFFLSLISFFDITKNRFTNWKYGILSVLILFLSPRIFANSFYNNLDIPFMSFMIFSFNYGIKILDKFNFKNLIFFSLFSAVAFDIRIIGIIIPFFVCVIFLIKGIKEKKFKPFFIKISTITVTTFLLIILFWPFLWSNPIEKLFNVFFLLSDLDFSSYNLYLGKLIPVTDTPWHYTIVWILITTPIIYLFFLFIGFFKFCHDNFKLKKYKYFYQDLIIILLITTPIAISIFLNTTLYDGWRHMYFLYPFLVIFMVSGVNYLMDKLNKTKIYYFFQLIIIISLIDVGYWMYKNHPHQYVFFNKLTSSNASKNFELDYLAASYKENLDFLIETEKKNKYYIYNSSKTKLWNPLFSLMDKDRLKFEEVEKQKAEYWITNYYFDTNSYDYNFKKKYILLNEVIVDGNKVNSLFKLRN